MDFSFQLATHDDAATLAVLRSSVAEHLTKSMDVALGHRSLPRGASSMQCGPREFSWHEKAPRLLAR